MHIIPQECLVAQAKIIETSTDLSLFVCFVPSWETLRLGAERYLLQNRRSVAVGRGVGEDGEVGGEELQHRAKERRTTQS